MATNPYAVIGIFLAGCASHTSLPVRPEPGPIAEEVVAPAETSADVASSPHVALGVPVDGDPSDDYLMDKRGFVLSYSDARHSPNWDAWRLTREDLGTEGRANDFGADKDLPTAFLQIGPKDYERSGYDRGHMCPSAHRTATRDANSVTFLMTNMQPQVHALNAGPWKSLETYERERAVEGKIVFVVAGGIFTAKPQRIRPGVAVPEASFRVTVVLDADQEPKDVGVRTLAFGTILPNDSSAKGHEWDEFNVAIDEIERRTGYDFLTQLDDTVEGTLEAGIGDATE